MFVGVSMMDKWIFVSDLSSGGGGGEGGGVLPVGCWLDRGWGGVDPGSRRNYNDSWEWGAGYSHQATCQSAAGQPRSYLSTGDLAVFIDRLLLPLNRVLATPPKRLELFLNVGSGCPST
jgi:hypothetical protein